MGSEGGWEVVEDGPGKQRQGQALLAGSPEGGSGKDLHSREQEAFRNSECSGAGAGGCWRKLEALVGCGSAGDCSRVFTAGATGQ